MSSFAALMALSQTQTKESDAAVKVALADRERKQAEARKAQEEKERKDREFEAKMRKKRLEEEQRDRERKDRMERESAARERERARREEEMRNALLYGPKKVGRTDANGYPAKRKAGGGGGGGGGARAGAGVGGSDDDDEPGSGAGANALTREEKRRRKFDLEMQKSLRAPRKPTSGYGKPGRRLPGGAVDITTTKDAISHVGTSGMSVRERLAMESMKLVKLNEHKRDTRTIEEILADKQKAKQAKTLAGDEARDFNDWFGKAKKDAPKKESVQPSATTTRDNTPGSQTPNPYATSIKSANRSASPYTKPSAPSRTSSVPRTMPTKPINTLSSKPAAGTSARSHPKPSHGGSFSASGSRPALSTKPSTSSIKTSASMKAIPKKRPRSPSPSVSPPPKRRTAAASTKNALSAEIWKLFGKDRDRYVEQDVFSDDDDMEAGASDLEREEMRRSVIHFLSTVFL